MFRNQDAYNKAVDATNDLLHEFCFSCPDMPVFYYLQDHSRVGANYRLEEHMRGQNVRIHLNELGLKAFRKRMIGALHLHSGSSCNCSRSLALAAIAAYRANR